MTEFSRKDRIRPGRQHKRIGQRRQSMKKTAANLILVLVMLMMGTAYAGAPDHEEVQTLLQEMLDAYRNPSPETLQSMDKTAAAIGNPVTSTMAESWKELFLNPDLSLFYSREDDPAVLEIPDPAKHAFVVLGYRLLDGEMELELKGRCRAAAEAAKAFPESLVICTGGPSGYTGKVDPSEIVSEAGLMRGYLIRKCGIKSERIRAEVRSLSTVQNALFTLGILREEGIETITVVTSGYHMRWALEVFRTAAAWSGEQGWPVEVIGNWCYRIKPEDEYDEMNAGITINQLRQMLITGQQAFYPAGE
jgi:hypothetical protein